MTDIEVRVADWYGNNGELRRIRQSVFIVEQAVPPELEWDAEDAQAIHFIAHSNEYAIGTARLLRDGHIGRVAVLRDWRGLGVGTALMQAALDKAHLLGLCEIKLAAQVQAIAFYERLGFQIISDEFIEAGIAHVEMDRAQEELELLRLGLLGASHRS